MDVCAGAMSVSSATGLASATMEIQAVFSARMSRVKVVGRFTEAGGLVLTLGGVAVAGDGFAEGLLVAEAGGDAAGGGRLGKWGAAGHPPPRLPPPPPPPRLPQTPPPHPPPPPG